MGRVLCEGVKKNKKVIPPEAVRSCLRERRWRTVTFSSLEGVWVYVAVAG